MHSHLDPRIPTMPERSASDVHRPGRYRVHQARNAVGCSASRMSGELLLRATCEAYLHTLCVLSCISDDSFEKMNLLDGAITAREGNGDTM